jgi:hypothetical protein
VDLSAGVLRAQQRKQRLRHDGVADPVRGDDQRSHRPAARAAGKGGLRAGILSGDP